jgi:transposase
MSAEDAAVKHDLETLRRDGSVVARFTSADDAAAWRATMRRTCRTAGLRVRTGLANADDRIAWAYHVDHVVTEAAERAARRAIEATYKDDEPRVPFHELVREEQRKMLRIVRPNDHS